MRLLLALLASGLLLLGGCVRSLQPVLKDDQVTMDPALAGTWVSEDGKQSFELTPDADARHYAVLYHDEKGKNAPFIARVGRVGELLLAEVRPGELPQELSEVYGAHLVPLYSFMIVQKTPQRLTLSVMSLEWLMKYLEAHPGELQVNVQEKDRTFITSPTEDIQKFILKHWKDKDAMGEPASFVRPGDASTRPAK